MGLYFTRTEHKNNYVNLRPIFEFTDDGLIDVDRDERFKPRGIIQVNGAQSIKNKLLNSRAYSLFILSDTLFYTLYQKDDGTKTIRAIDFVNNAKNIDSDYRVKEVIDIPIELNFDRINEWNSLTDILEPITRYIYLSNSEFVAGPFFWNKDDLGYKFTPAITSGNSAYMINIYNFDDLKVEPNIYDFDASKDFDDIDIYGRIKHLLYGTERALPKPIKQIDCISDKELKTIVGRLLSQDLETKKQKQEIKKLINNLPETEISEVRKRKIDQLLQNSDEIDNFISSIPSIILKNEKSTQKIAEKIFDDENYKNDDKLINYVKQISGYKENYQILEEQKYNLEQEIKNIKIERKELIKQGQGTISSKEKKELEDKLSELREQHNVLQINSEKISKELNDYKSTCKSIDELKQSEKDLKSAYRVRQNDIDTLSNKLEEGLNEAYSNLSKQNFDEEVANKIAEASSTYRNNLKKEEFYKSIDANKSKLSLSEMHDLHELIDFIHTELSEKADREVDKNDIVNILLCLSQGFITVLAGEPGTGKTSLVNLIAKILGLNNEVYNRFVQISVEKGWTSKRDLIGYYNPLSKTFEANDKRMLHTLKTLDYEVENNSNDLPFLILLDEANLSQMEYYWGDFMTLCDLDNPNRSIYLSEEIKIKIPDTLRFIATINLDNTTETLSPRFIDRAWIIKLKAETLDIDDFEIDFGKFERIVNENPYPTIPMDTLKPFYDIEEFKKNDVGDIFNKLKNILVLFEKQNIVFSPRVIGMIKRYCLAGKGYFDKDKVEANAYAALDYAVAQKILPKINGYGEEYRSFIEKLLIECDDKSMHVCNDILNNILQIGKLNMGYYQFFSR